MTASLGRQVTRALAMACEVLFALFVLLGTGCATPSASAPTPMPTQVSIDSGIYGHMTAALGIAPANPPSTQCVAVYDSAGAKLIARATCTGMARDFRVPLPPGRYVVEFGGSWESRNGAVVFVPDRRDIDIGQGQWVKLVPPAPRGPVP